MSSDDHATYSRELKPRHSMGFSKAIETVKSLYSLFTVLGAVAAAMWAGFSFMATDQELLQHNLAMDAHKSIRMEIAELRAEVVALKTSYQRCYEEHGELGWRWVSYQAADREPDHRLKAAAGYFYRDEFIVLWRKGTPVGEAINGALRTPWHDRPKTK